jgi:hypothetical protein
MRFEISRLRPGELIAGASAVALLVLMFAVPWYGVKTPLGYTAATLGVPTSFTGWDSLAHIRYLVLLTALGALALVYFQSTRRSPAIPTSLSIVLSAVAALTVLVLLYRVLVNVPGPGDLNRRAGSYLGLLAAIGVCYGAYRSLRQEGVAPADGPGEAELIALTGAARPQPPEAPEAPRSAEPTHS